MNAPTSGRHPTSVDVARAAGVSQATVSRALSGGTVSEATRRNIEGIAARLGYSPNLVARGLVTHRTGMVGVIVADITNPFYPQILEALGSRLEQAGTHMILHNATEDSEGEVAGLLVQQRVDGIIFTTAMDDSVAVRELTERRFPLVLVNRVVGDESDSVQGDNVAGAVAAVNHLVALGHRHIGVVTGDPRASTTRQRSDGFDRAMSESGLTPRPGSVRVTDFTYAAAYAAARSILEAESRPSAIFCHNDLAAFAAINAARSLGLSVPRDLSVIGFDDVRESAWESYDLTTVRQPLEDMASAAVDLLSDRIEDPALARRQVIFDAPLVVRGTTAPPTSDSVP